MSSPTTPVMTLPVDNTPVPVPVEPETIPEYDTLVSSLRASLASTQTLLQSQSDRLMQLSDLEVELSTLKDQNTFIAAAKEAVETQLKDEVKRREVAEENVELLRGQVEQARRGVMVLQKQDKDRKRASLLPGTTGLGLQPDEGEEVVLSEGPTKLTKRQSIMGRGHRRVSSQSEPGEPSPITDSKGTTTTTKGGLRELRLGTSSAITTPPAPDSAPSGFFDESTPMPSAPGLTKRSSSSGLTASPSKSELAVKEETSRLRADVQALQKRLAASEEARVASESALKALREFMTGGSGDAAHVDEMMQRGSMNDSMASLLKGIRLPPLPTDREVEDESSAGGLFPGDKDKREEKKIWGFKLFGNKPGAPPSPALSTAVEPPATPHLNLSPPLSSNRSSGTTPKMSPLPTPGELPTESNVSAVPPSNTPLGNFVSGWTKGIASPSTPAPPLTTRKLSSFFSRKRASTVEGEKELPPAPTDDVVDLTEDEEAQGEQVELHAVEDEDKADQVVKNQAQVDVLEPSPEIAEKVNEEEQTDNERGESSVELKDEKHQTFQDAQTDVELPETEETAPLPETEEAPAETHEK
ncbi:hypothetical protein BCR39DRAFT_199968 [Naematelia encephala]|uniref:Uncharacterized protein n=1 Tax=Naematelia encephala TaxID=71784 RepID=A0A1Y2B3F9_9TREE|nr:hypothetical protein BCR39DRAFT_199968 [Naematelia encephala]